MELSSQDVQTTSKGHCHLIVGAGDMVNIYGIPGGDMSGPLYNVVYYDPEKAIDAWVSLVESLGNTSVSGQELEEVTETILDALDDYEHGVDTDHQPMVYFDADGELHDIIGVAACSGDCIPKSMN